MLIYCHQEKISRQMQRCGFAFAYKSGTDASDLASRPWLARKRWMNQRFLNHKAGATGTAICCPSALFVAKDFEDQYAN
ncbi:hypothetical protein FEF65_03195 [Mariprofundus erugo]|uniref:Uncharacterized protein n=1 Tax=Mariprofundus erugo TaxID=2528639 RepID=A0A5R9GR39_9PROT|nr:hypothetical protein [Mariprofundus erugo]TLS68716.1 hypothetical protein FEF65_03195 [Mariprofundus erugo]